MADPTTTTADATRRQVTELLGSYFRLTLRVNLDEDIPACVDEIVALRGQWIAEALEELAAGEAHLKECPPWPALCAHTLRRLAAEYRAGRR